MEKPFLIIILGIVTVLFFKYHPIFKKDFKLFENKKTKEDPGEND